MVETGGAEEMSALIKKISKTAGLVPGTLVHVGDKRTEKVRITVIDYKEKEFQEKEVQNIEECFSFEETDTVTWVNIDGVHDTEVIEKIGKRFELHPLILEDIVNTEQRPKYEDSEKYIFIALKMLWNAENNMGIKSEQVSLVLGKNYVFSFQEKEGDVFNPIRDRIRNAKGRIRSQGPDYLAYSLLDAIVDNYFIVLEKTGEKIESVEEELMTNPTSATLHSINKLKSEIISLRKAIWPLRDIISSLERSESSLVKRTTHIFLRDVYDHTVQIMDSVETFRDMISGKLEMYLSSVSNRMNEVMKVLTIIATIFIPITFIAGVYGMNFNPGASRLNMPELNWPFGYIFAWGLMLAVVMVMITYFKRKKWF